MSEVSTAQKKISIIDESLSNTSLSDCHLQMQLAGNHFLCGWRSAVRELMNGFFQAEAVEANISRLGNTVAWLMTGFPWSALIRATTAPIECGEPKSLLFTRRPAICAPANYCWVTASWKAPFAISVSISRMPSACLSISRFES